MRRLIQLTLTASLLLLGSVSAFAKDSLNINEQLLANQYLQRLGRWAVSNQ